MPPKLKEHWSRKDAPSISQIVGGEVLNYNKRILLKNSAIKSQAPWANGIRDIHRLHMEQWCRTLADHKMKIHMLDKDGNIISKNTKRIYEVQFGIELQSKYSDSIYLFGTIELTKRGIRRIILD